MIFLRKKKYDPKSKKIEKLEKLSRRLRVERGTDSTHVNNFGLRRRVPLETARKIVLPFTHNNEMRHQNDIISHDSLTFFRNLAPQSALLVVQ